MYACMYTQEKLKDDVEDERQSVARLSDERKRLAALGPAEEAVPTKAALQSPQGLQQDLQQQLSKEFKQSFSLNLDRSAPRPIDALSDLD